MYLTTLAKPKSGHKLPGPRYADGRLKKPTAQQRKNRERERNMRETVTVMRQPHRKDAKDPSNPKLESALGTFQITHGLHDAIYDAGMEYAATMRLWRAAKGIPTIEREGVGGSGQGPTDEQVAAWWAKIEKIERALMNLDTRNRHFFAVRRLCVDNISLTAEYLPVAIPALLVLADVLEKNLGKHPFAKAGA